ncbi:hypothetical protein [Endothiovibrio diazotrophicus]
MKIKIPISIEKEEFDRLCLIWERRKNISIEMNLDSYSEGQVENLFDVAESAIPCELSFVVIEAIAEFSGTPAEILKKIVFLSDVACREAVCLREGLDDELIAVCERLVLAHKREKN